MMMIAEDWDLPVLFFFFAEEGDKATFKCVFLKYLIFVYNLSLKRAQAPIVVRVRAKSNNVQTSYFSLLQTAFNKIK